MALSLVFNFWQLDRDRHHFDRRDPLSRIMRVSSVAGVKLVLRRHLVVL